MTDTDPPPELASCDGFFIDSGAIDNPPRMPELHAFIATDGADPEPIGWHTLTLTHTSAALELTNEASTLSDEAARRLRNPTPPVHLHIRHDTALVFAAPIIRWSLVKGTALTLRAGLAPGQTL